MRNLDNMSLAALAAELTNPGHAAAKQAAHIKEINAALTKVAEKKAARAAAIAAEKAAEQERINMALMRACARWTR